MSSDFSVVVYVKEHKHRGLELVTSQAIKAGTRVWKWSGKYAIETKSWGEIQKMSAASRTKFLERAWQVGEDQFEYSKGDVMTDYSNFINHSCDPNLWFCGEDIHARRDIKTGDTLTLDYSSMNCKYNQVEKCYCEAPKCRGRASMDDYVQLEHLWGHMAPYLDQKIGKMWKLKTATGTVLIKRIIA